MFIVHVVQHSSNAHNTLDILKKVFGYDDTAPYMIFKLLKKTKCLMCN